MAMTLLIAGQAAAQAPRIGKPRPAPPQASMISPLPPAEIDNKLVIGGDDIRAREIGTRMSVDVFVNGRGPYRFAQLIAVPTPPRLAFASRMLCNCLSGRPRSSPG